MFFVALFLVIILIIVTIIVINNSYVHAVSKAKEQIINSLSEPAVVVNAKQKILFFNAAAENTSGITAKNAIGQQIDTILKFSNEQTAVPYALYSASTGNE